jgi:RimJ/RimL family protein N-acetyltransferase
MFPIKTNLFELRPWQIEDIASLAENANNINIWNNVRDSFPHPYTIEDGQAYITMDMQRPYIQNLAIVIDDKAVGGVGIVPQTDVERFSAEMGYWIGEYYWGKGIVTEVVKTALNYFFSHREIVRIYAFVYEYNISSMRVLEKAGFRKVGIMEKAVYKNNKFLNTTYYEILK